MKKTEKTSDRLLALSLFSSAGIGDLGFRAAEFDFVGFSELEADRVGLIKTNYPNANYYTGDIWETKNEIIASTRAQLKKLNKKLSLVSCTAPCQGMSKNGQGTLLKNIREGKRPTLDVRNRLIIPALEIINALQPEWVVFENVPEMSRTIIEDDEGNFVSILDLIEQKLKGYVGRPYDVEVADYGIAQRRQRLITVYSKSKYHKTLIELGGQLVPPTTHSKVKSKYKHKWNGVLEELKSFPPLDAKSKDKSAHPNVPFHRVPLLDERKYFWVSNTPKNKSAFDNQCVACGYDKNLTHSSKHDLEGINRASKETPILCESCGEVLPRPSVIDPDGRIRLMAGFTSAYKRMSPDLPSPTLTRNFSYACSDSKIHPTQNRVLSIAEALHLQTISTYQYRWEITSGESVKPASDALIRLMIGESVPPKFLELLGRHLIKTSSGDFSSLNDNKEQKDLFLS
jgi:DNA (cytosine-5)-methyltransferase 1